MGLAERVLLDQRPGLDELDAWMAWERRLWRVHQDRRHWERLVKRVEELPDALPTVFLLEARGIGIEALMQQRNYDEARSRLRKLLLAEGATPVLRSDWRRKIFTTYLWRDDLDDADAAMLQYQNDFYPDDHTWNILRARVLIRSGEPGAAISQVASVTTPEGVLVGLYGRLLNRSMTPNEVIDKAGTVEERSLDDSLRRERFVLIAEAAKRSGSLAVRVQALERALEIQSDAVNRPLIEVGIGDLVDAYMSLAERIANTANLLVGDFDGWLSYAKEKLADSPTGRRAIYAYIGKSAGLAELANDSFSRLADSLRQGGLKPVIFKLFGEDGALGGYDMLRGPIGYLLSEEALQEGDIRLAAALSAGIVQPPSGVSHFDWRLRQARMAVYAGNIQDGLETLESLIGALTTLRDDETDRLLQVVFDLQALERHAEVLPLLERILELTSEPDRQREILFWLAESVEGSGSPEQAALYFLRSSTMAGGNVMWEQSAQYRAAGALQDAGLIDDARALYRRLLASTRDPARRDQLTRKLQDLWLLENKPDDVVGDD
ncbi:MAG: hypothetical protein DWQ08_06755 [Proteobacteria bacterium]|nr:MAG: hypothetical protein DWQ08_06755 [Pseudomonadota bacterium]